MRRKKPAQKEAPKAAPHQDDLDVHPPVVLAMLESLVDALDNKAEQIEGAGESDDDEIRAGTIRDVAEAIRDRFGL